MHSLGGVRIGMTFPELDLEHSLGSKTVEQKGLDVGNFYYTLLFSLLLNILL